MSNQGEKTFELCSQQYSSFPTGMTQSLLQIIGFSFASQYLLPHIMLANVLSVSLTFSGEALRIFCIFGEKVEYFFATACPARAPSSLLSRSLSNSARSSGVNLANSACSSSSVKGCCGAQETKNINITNNELITSIFLIYIHLFFNACIKKRSKGLCPLLTSFFECQLYNTFDYITLRGLILLSTSQT